MSNLKEHDNTDRDIIIINKDSLILKLFQSKEFYNSSNSTFGFGGIALAFLSTGYLTEIFHNVGYIPGETIRAIFIVLGLVFTGFTIKSFLSWLKLKGTHEPTKMVSDLLKTELGSPSPYPTQKETKKYPATKADRKNHLDYTVK